MGTFQFKYSREETVPLRSGAASLLSVRFEFSYTVTRIDEWQKVLQECGYYYSPAHHGYFHPELGLLTYLHEVSRDFDHDPDKFREWYHNLAKDPEFKEKIRKMGELVLESLKKLY